MSSSAGPVGAEPDVAAAQNAATREKVAFIRTLGPPDAPLEVRETHMSYVFIGQERVLKLKKPVRYAYLDFSTLAARATSCREEVRLNRRLAPAVYLGVRALVRGPGGHLSLDGAEAREGTVVDWLVEMRRLPAARMLDAAIVAGDVSEAAIEAVGACLASFYAHAERPDVEPDAVVEHHRRALAVDRAILTARDFALDHGRDAHVLDALERRLDEHAAELRQRAATGLIVEGHGDLRPEHICLTDPPAIIDCLEFNRGLRLVDPYEEIAHLDVECRRLGAAWIGPRLLDLITGELGHRPGPRLIGFYAAFRALTRARLSLAHLLEPAPRDLDRWQPLARQYLDLAEAALG